MLGELHGENEIPSLIEGQMSRMSDGISFSPCNSPSMKKDALAASLSRNARPSVERSYWCCRTETETVSTTWPLMEAAPNASAAKTETRGRIDDTSIFL